MSGYKKYGLAHYFEGEHMKRYLPLILALLLFPFTANGGTLVSGSFENGMSPFNGPYYQPPAQVISDSTAPDGTHSLQFTIPYQMGGNSPDIIDARWSSQDEIWVQFYIKFSSNYQWPSIQDKFVFLPLQGNNFYIGAQWGNQVSMCTQVSWGQGSTCWGGGGWSKGVWQKVVFHGKANSGTSGVGQVWVNDILVIDARNVNFRQNSGDGAFSGIMLENVFGSGSRSGFPMYTYYDAVTVQTTSFSGVAPAPASAPKTPEAPSTLIVK